MFTEIGRAILARKLIEDLIIEKGFGELTKEDANYIVENYGLKYKELIDAYEYFTSHEDQTEFREQYVGNFGGVK